MDLTTLERLPLWIGGRATPARTTRYGEVTNPATGEVLRHVPFATAEDVAAAVACRRCSLARVARGARPAPRAHPDALSRTAGDAQEGTRAPGLARSTARRCSDAEGSITRGIEVVEFATGIPHLLKGEFSENVGSGVDSFSLRQPVGVCAGITPFNFPAMVPLWMFPVALACGNTFILKPSERDPTLSLRMAELLQEAGLPDGVFNVVHGDKEAVDAILEHPGHQGDLVRRLDADRKIHLRTGTAHGKRVQALGGAKNHAVVLPDADLDFAAEALIGAAYGSAGERCMAVSVVVAVGDAGDPLRDLLAERARRVVVGPGRPRRNRKWGRSSPARRAIASSGSSMAASPKARRSSSTAASNGRRARRRLLCRAHAVRPRDAGDGDLPRGDLRAGAGDRARRFACRRRSR